MLMSLRHFCNIVEMIYCSGLHSCDNTKIKQKNCFIFVYLSLISVVQLALIIVCTAFVITLYFILLQ